MRILVLYRQGSRKIRNTIIDHAFSFQRYDLRNEYFYFNVFNGRYASDYEWIAEDMFDAVIFHYSLLALRTEQKYWNPFMELMGRIWKRYPCIKVLLPQDDYTYTKGIWNFNASINATNIYTVIREEDYYVLYPQEHIKNCKVNTVLTGYVEKNYLRDIYKIHCARQYDIVYKARKLTYDFGRQGQLKYELVEKFEKWLKNGNFRIHLGNTIGDEGAVLGDGWMKLLGEARVTLGCLSGSSVADTDRNIHNVYSEYMKFHPEAEYEKAKEDCFPQLDENIHGVVSPRIFESAITKTCQVLVGRDYQGILQPDIDYIVLEEDYSNIGEVLDKVKDIKYCENIAWQCFRSVVESGQYSYKVFVDKIVEGIKREGLVERKKDNRLSEKINKCCEKNNMMVWKELPC